MCSVIFQPCVFMNLVDYFGIQSGRRIFVYSSKIDTSMRNSKLIIISIFSLFCFQSYAQNFDSTKYIEPYYDLSLTPAQRDSLQESMQSLGERIRALHQYSLPNQVIPAMIFDPMAFVELTLEEQENIEWSLPENVSLPANRADLAFYTIDQLASLIKSRKITSVELTQFFIDRLKMHGDTLECVVTLMEESALEQARAADAALIEGFYRGPLHGIPYGIKDLFSVEGTKTTWGAMPYKDQNIPQTATVALKLKEAGAILVAKLTLGALAMGDVWFGGVTKNPWNLEQGSSGSSAGSASAVAAGLLPFALGTETLGSIVSPSTRCGTTGLRPTFGRVSRTGGMALSWSMDKVGPITRSAKDAAMVFDAIRGSDPEDPSTRDGAFNYKANVPVETLKVGYMAGAFEGQPRDSLTLIELRNLGIDIQPVELPEDFPLWAMTIILASESSAAFDDLTRSGADSTMVRQDRGAWPNYFRSARFIPATEYVNANRIRTNLIKALDEALKGFDVVVAPSFSRQLVMTNLTGHPCLVLPNGFTENGSPTSITFIANYMDEASLIALGEAYQRGTDHDDKHPEAFLK